MWRDVNSVTVTTGSVIGRILWCTLSAWKLSRYRTRDTSEGQPTSDLLRYRNVLAQTLKKEMVRRVPTVRTMPEQQSGFPPPGSSSRAARIPAYLIHGHIHATDEDTDHDRPR